MLLSLAACDNSSISNDTDGTTDENLNNTNEDITTNNEQSKPSDDLKNKIDVSKITSSTEFSEGKAWVRCGEMTSDEYTTLYCINKTGEILFTVTNTFLNSPSPFYNGLSVVPIMIDGEGVYCICDENGNVTKPSDIGATEFLIKSEQSYNLFEDGYIFAKKTEATFSGSSVTAAILNSSLEFIVGYSEEVLALYEDYIYSYYYNGYLYNINEYYNEYKVFDIKAGKEIDDVSAFVSSFEPEYASDMWDWDSQSCFYYDSLASTFTVTLDLSEYSETIFRMYPFESGKAPLVFKSADKAFFTVIKEDGSFCFEPVELSGNSWCDVKTYNGKYLVVNEGYNKDVLETFDVNGKIAEAEITVTGLVPSVKFCDDVIHISSTDMNCYYSLELEPLF